MTVADLLNKVLMWNKEKVIIERDLEYTKMDRLEFQYEALENDWIVSWFEPCYDRETKTPYLLIHCE